jgi:hypothetical protein
MANAANSFYGTGRRKTSSARVYLRQGSGKVSINGRTLDEFFGRETGRMIVQQPFGAVQLDGKFDVRKSVVAKLVAAPSSRNVSHESAPFASRAHAIGFGGSSSGRTTVSDTVYLGSNPSPPAKQGPLSWALFFRV